MYTWKFLRGRFFHIFCDLTEGTRITTVNFQYSIVQYLSLIASLRKKEQRMLGQGAFCEILDP